MMGPGDPGMMGPGDPGMIDPGPGMMDPGPGMMNPLPGQQQQGQQQQGQQEFIHNDNGTINAHVQDFMVGTPGINDIFKFQLGNSPGANDGQTSGPALANNFAIADTIIDFTPGEDKIKLEGSHGGVGPAGRSNPLTTSEGFGGMKVLTLNPITDNSDPFFGWTFAYRMLSNEVVFRSNDPDIANLTDSDFI